MTGRPPEFAEKVLGVVETIPAGRVMTYGDVAAALDAGGPRQVGAVMAQWGSFVAWWRVVHADGSFLRGHEQRALAAYTEEGTPLRRGPDGAPLGVDMRRARLAAGGGLPDGTTPAGHRMSEASAGMLF